MSDKKVSDLTALAAASVDVDNDVLNIVDTSAGTSGSKKITVQALADVVIQTADSFTQSGSGASSRTAQAKMREIVSIADFGATGSSAQDAATEWQAAITASAGRMLWYPKGTYKSSVALTNASAVTHRGEGIFNTACYRNFSPSGDSEGLFNVGELADGTAFEDMSIFASASTSGGCLISILASASETPSGCSMKNLWLSIESGSDLYKYAIYVDGSLKTGSPVGVRDMNWTNVSAFGGVSGAVFLKSVVQFGWYGGGAFQSGGTSGKIEITGTASVPSNYVDISLPNANDGLSLDRLQYGTFTFGQLGGSVTNTANVDSCSIRARFTGSTLETDWTNSSYIPTENTGASVYLTSSTGNTVTGDGTAYVVLFDSEWDDKGDCYNATNGRFTAAVPGWHSLESCVLVQNLGAAHTTGVIDIIHRNSGGIVSRRNFEYNVAAIAISTNCSLPIVGKFFMGKGDTVEVRVTIAGSTKTVGVNGAAGATGAQYTHANFSRLS
jgi:hypothetical protein